MQMNVGRCGMVLASAWLAVACEHTTGIDARQDEAPQVDAVAAPGEAASSAGQSGQAAVAGDLVPAEPSGIDAARPMELPRDWRGTGVLSRRTEKLPKGLPKWVAVEAEVVSRDGTRMLVASGVAEKIANPALARSTAENRARAVMSKWLGEARLEGAKIVDASWNKRRRLAAVKVEVEVPADWGPGT